MAWPGPASRDPAFGGSNRGVTSPDSPGPDPTLQAGRRLVAARREEQEGPLQQFVEDLHERHHTVERVPETAIFLNRGKTTAPLAMRSNVVHNRVLHDSVVIVSVETLPVPVVAAEDIAVVDHLRYSDDGITHVTARFGYMQRTDVRATLAALAPEDLEAPIDLDDAVFFLSTIELQVDDSSGLPRWRKLLFVATSYLAADAVQSFDLPRDRTVLVGSQVVV